MKKLELVWCRTKTGQQVEVKREHSCAQGDSPSPPTERADFLEEYHCTGLWLHKGKPSNCILQKRKLTSDGKWNREQIRNLLIKGHESSNWQNCMLKLQLLDSKAYEPSRKLHGSSWTQSQMDCYYCLSWCKYHTNFKQGALKVETTELKQTSEPLIILYLQSWWTVGYIWWKRNTCCLVPINRKCLSIIYQTVFLLF